MEWTMFSLKNVPRGELLEQIRELKVSDIMNLTKHIENDLQ